VFVITGVSYNRVDLCNKWRIGIENFVLYNRVRYTLTFHCLQKRRLKVLAKSIFANRQQMMSPKDLIYLMISIHSYCEKRL